MHTLPCDPTGSLTLDLPCAQPGAFSATLDRVGFVSVDLTATPSIDGHQLTLTGIPEDLKAGVWYLTVLTPCGCFRTLVTHKCPAPALPGTHTATFDPSKVMECCE